MKQKFKDWSRHFERKRGSERDKENEDGLKERRSERIKEIINRKEYKRKEGKMEENQKKKGRKKEKSKEIREER